MMKHTLTLGTALAFLFSHGAVAQTAPETDLESTQFAPQVDVSDEETLSTQAQDGTQIYVYSPGAKEFRLGCDMPREDDNRAITMAYAPSTEQIYLNYTTAGIKEGGGKIHTGEGLNGEGALAAGLSESDIKYQNAFWLVASHGPDPEPNAQEYAIIYGDIENERAIAYVYEKKDMEGSYENGKFLGSAEGAVRVTREGGYQTVSMILDVSEINAAFGDAAWKGAQFGEHVGMWIQGGYDSEIVYAAGAAAAAGGGTTIAGGGGGSVTTGGGEAGGGGGSVTTGGGETDTGVITGGGGGFSVTSFSFGKDGAWYDTPHVKERDTKTVPVAFSNGTMQALENTAGKAAAVSPFSAASQADGDTPLTRAQFEDAMVAAGVDDEATMRFGATEERKQSYVWCTLLSELVTATPQAMNAWVVGPRWGFVAENTLEVECLGDLKIGIQTTAGVTGITAIHQDGREVVLLEQAEADIDERMQALEEQYGMSIMNAAEGAESSSTSQAKVGLHWVLNNGEEDDKRFFDYGEHTFTLKISMLDGTEHSVEHEIILPRPPWGQTAVRAAGQAAGGGGGGGNAEANGGGQAGGNAAGEETTAPATPKVKKKSFYDM